MNGLFIPNHLDGVGLSLTARNEIEGGVVAEVLELLSGSPADIHGLDLLSVELVGGVGTFGGKFAMEAAEVAKTYLIACEKLLAKTSDGISQNTFHSTLGEGAVVVGDVLTSEIISG